MPKSTIREMFERDDAARSEILDRARLCAALAKPWILPPKNHSPTQRLPDNFQSLGGHGTTNLVGKMLLALFPTDIPFFQLLPAASIRYDPAIPVEVIQQIEQALYLRELMVMSALESADLRGSGPHSQRRRGGFRSRKRQTLEQLVITGDALECLTPDYRIINFRRDQYVTKRDSSGDVLYHIIRECVDAASLTREVYEKAKLPSDFLEKPTGERVVDLWTLVDWQPQSSTWKITQEINGNAVTESQETISQYFSTPYELAPGEDYGRGFIELRLGDFRSLDNLSERVLDFAAAASKLVPIIDPTSDIRPSDMSKPTGEPIYGRVSNGIPQQVAFLKVDKLQDFGVVQATIERIRTDLGKAMLVESEVQPTGDRVTATQVSRIAAELELALGGAYAPIAEEQQTPLVQRTIHQMEAQRILQPLPGKSIEIRTITGIAALSREIKAAKLVEMMTLAANLGPEAMRKINIDVLVDVIARYRGIDEPGIIKTRAQIEEEIRQQIAAQGAAEAQTKAIDVAGNVVEKTATGGRATA